MEMPTERQITEAIVESKLRGESEAELFERVELMCRLSDTKLAAMGIYPLSLEPALSPSKGQS